MNYLDESGMGGVLTYKDHMQKLEAAVKASVAAEREACAHLCESGMDTSEFRGGRLFARPLE